MHENSLLAQRGSRIFLQGHFDVPVILEHVRPLGDDRSKGYELRVRLPDGTLEETVISSDEASTIINLEEKTPPRPVDAERLRLLVESVRISLAYSYDRQFAVSLSGIRTLPHQIEAVYLKMLPQPRLRFLLADDPGAGKTIMAGLLIKELKLRGAIERCLILTPAPLTIQWQDELSRFFNEQFQIVHSANDQQLSNLWERENLVISSMDYAKQDNVRERVWQQRWDLIVIDEAHKCSAYTKRSIGRGNSVERTKRYQLAEQLSECCDNLLLLTATPHHGDEDRFAHFIRLLDRDLFPEPHRFAERSGQIRRDILQLKDCPWSLRRLKEDLKDMYGNRLFPDRHVQTINFYLGPEEYQIYKSITAYINKYLPRTTGRRGNSVALARTVFQRRLASSTHAIHESLMRRRKKLSDLLQELDGLSNAQRVRKISQLQEQLPDTEQEEDDLDEATRDEILDEITTTAELDLDHIREEIAELGELVAHVCRVRENGRDSKLIALRDCVQRSEFSELKDGRGKLLIFTEHRDTLNHLRNNLEKWGYSTCEIHGGMNPQERKETQEHFRIDKQICVATEAAGEGINLQFCHLMINYDMPWNPTRLEQRLGRIHRIGQSRDVYAFNFVATSSKDGQPVIEGRILERLLSKLDSMREALGDRVFDVIGEVLSLNKINLPEMLREVAYEPKSLDSYLDVIEQIDPKILERHETATGIALARAHVDFSSFDRANMEAEERRLMPRYVESFFIAAAKEVGLRVEKRTDELWRIGHVLADLRSEHLTAIKRLGKPETSYRKVTFYKKHLEQDQHLDAVLLGPGHPVYAAVDERLRESLHNIEGRAAIYVDPTADAPYCLHFYEISVRGQTAQGENITVHAELVGVREETGKSDSTDRYSIVPADALIDLPAHPCPPKALPEIEHSAINDYVKAKAQMERRNIARKERSRYADVACNYLKESFKARIRAIQDRVMDMRARESSEPELSLTRQRAEQNLRDLQRTKTERLSGTKRLRVARPGPVRHIASCFVLPPDTTASDLIDREENAKLRQQVEIAAEDIVIAYEESQGRECERVGSLKIGFDIRSLAPANSQTGYRDPVIGVRRIEVKGRQKGMPIRLTTNEWYKAQQLGDTYWLYVVWNPLDNPDPIPLMVQNPAKNLDHAKKEVVTARYYDLPADAVEKAARKKY